MTDEMQRIIANMNRAATEIRVARESGDAAGGAKDQSTASPEPP